MSEQDDSPPLAPPPPPASPPVVAPPVPAGFPSPIAHPHGVSQEERTMGILIHLLAILTGFLGPLILWLVKKDSSRFIDHHGKEALNFQITLTIVLLGAGIGGFAVAALTAGIALIILIPLMFVIPIMALVFEIIACVNANRGVWHRYPMTIRLIP
jgi:uncharacterized Tic20 family protein